MCGGVVPQQPPTMFSQPFCAHSLKLRRERLRRFRETGREQRVGQAGVRIRADVNWRDAGKLLDERTQFLGPERAVHADAQSRGTLETEFQNASTVWPVTPRLLPAWINVTEARIGNNAISAFRLLPSSFGKGQGTDSPFIKDFLNREKCRPRIKRVENGFHEQ